MTIVSETFQQSVQDLANWLRFLELKEAEFTSQLERARGTDPTTEDTAPPAFPGVAPLASPVAVSPIVEQIENTPVEGLATWALEDQETRKMENAATNPHSGLRPSGEARKSGGRCCARETLPEGLQEWQVFPTQKQELDTECMKSWDLVAPPAPLGVAPPASESPPQYRGLGVTVPEVVAAIGENGNRVHHIPPPMPQNDLFSISEGETFEADTPPQDLTSGRTRGTFEEEPETNDDDGWL
jgi:hypothetical protein